MKDDLSDLELTTPGEFEDALGAVVEAAVKQDVDVRGAWEFQTKGSIHNWEAEIVELDRDTE